MKLADACPELAAGVRQLATPNDHMPYKNATLCVPRGKRKLEKGIVVESTISSVPEGHVLIEVDRFGWSANNVTYGLLGEDPHFRYFDFHPAPKTRKTSPETHGIIPVWGFGTVVESQVTQIQNGERVLGYFPSAKYMLVEVDENDINPINFYASRPHLPSDRRPYNQITRCAADPFYVEDQEDASMLYRPLFWTSFWCEDWLNSINYRAAKQVIVSSASSKTGFCLALAIRKRIEKAEKELKIIGLTSASNKAFVDGLGLYDQVLLYDDLATIDPKAGPYCYVDVAGNDQLNTRVEKHLGTALSFGVSLGMSHVSSTPTSIKRTSEKSGTKFEMFFMPEWLHVVRSTTPVKEIVALQKEGWAWIMEDGPKWVKMETVRGSKKVLGKFKETLKGALKPDVGLIFTLWDEQPVKARL